MRVLPLLLVSLLGCGGQSALIEDSADEAFTDKGKAVVYGSDDRTDVYAHPDTTMKQRALQSTVALVLASDLVTTNPAAIRFRGATLGQAENLCAGQRFSNDPTTAFCSGTLIDDDVVLTAGHCIENASDCASSRFVFRYARSSASTLETVTSADVFSCASIITRSLTTTAQGVSDFALIRLDRPAAPRFTPAPVRLSSSPLVTGQRVGVIGSGSGVPFKIDTGGMVRDRGTGVDFEVTTDTFGGNSGSGVYELDGYSVAGILVEGDTDYVANGACNVVNVCRETGCSGETAVSVRVALDAFCRVARSPRLCGASQQPAPVPPPAFSYQGRSTSNATRSTANQTVTLRRGQTLTAGTCQLAGSTGTGDTFLRIARAGALSTTLAQNDDACGQLSFLSFVAPADGEYVIRAGCYASTACTGTVAFQVR
ncbi:MAG: trypsin-like serine protease [Myxococcaceae bacterium]|nr:trypsin-like serine protease [Myxococcaceae bacterium]